MNTLTQNINIKIPVITIIYTNHEGINSYSRFINSCKGGILSLPFYSDDEEGNYIYKGHLFYHDKENQFSSENKLYEIATQTYLNHSIGGMAGNLSPLPYKLVDKSKVNELLDFLIQNNTTVDLFNHCYI